MKASLLAQLHCEQISTQDPELQKVLYHVNLTCAKYGLSQAKVITKLIDELD